jgi:hypothetical protein
MHSESSPLLFCCAIGISTGVSSYGMLNRVNFRFQISEEADS